MKKLILLVLPLLLISCGSAATEDINKSGANEKKTVDVKVTDKVVKTGTESSKYLVFTDKGTYEITDSILNWQFNSSDIYGYIEKDACYTFGIDRFSFRVGFMSMYENITSATKTDCKKD